MEGKRGISFQPRYFKCVDYVVLCYEKVGYVICLLLLLQKKVYVVTSGVGCLLFLRMVGSSGIDVRMLLSRDIHTLWIRIWARIFLLLISRA